MLIQAMDKNYVVIHLANQTLHISEHPKGEGFMLDLSEHFVLAVKGKQKEKPLVVLASGEAETTLITIEPEAKWIKPTEEEIREAAKMFE